MADFETCYFCGAGPSDAVEEVGVVPAAFDPTRDQQQSVVLCPDCREKLTAVMEAAVEAAGDGADGGAGGPDRHAAGGTGDRRHESDHSRSRRPSGAAGDGDSTGGDAGGSTDALADVGGVSGGGVSNGSAGTDAEPSSDPAEGTDDDGSGGRDETASGARDGDQGSDDETDGDGITVRDEDDEEGIRHTSGEGVSFGTATAGDEDAEGGEGDDEAPPQRETGAASVDSSDGDVMDRGSAAYRQVIRLLQNREFPVERDEIAAVAASAYELSPDETQDAIDAILQKGLLVEEDGVLRKP